MSPELLLRQAIIPAMAFLPAAMDGSNARAMCIAIAIQESGLMHRRQVGGPARGYWQFERGGVRGVLKHQKSKPHIIPVLQALNYTESDCYIAIEHNDVLAAVFSRLLLWTLPDKLPQRNSPASGWTQYVSAWRPGKPHRETWDQNFERAWDIV